MALPAAESALVAGLRALRLFRLAGHFDAHSLVADFLAVHAINSLVESLFRVEHLIGWRGTMKA